MDSEMNSNFSFDLPKNKSNVIKVIGVGGGGSNAINHMFKKGINGVDFVILNTDAQALNDSPVPIKIQLGATLTEGLGAGANPEVGAMAAKESFEEIKNLLSTQTKMVFITAGMGGGTGTGAAPIIAKMAKEMDILTVGIVTMPFQFEGKLRIDQAELGLQNIKKNVDALIVINNNKLREVYGNLGFKAGFSKADEVLSTAARGIAEVITHHYRQNIDLKDARTVLKDSGTAIMGSGSASGENRAQEAIINALDSPLLNDNKISGCKNVLLLIVSGSEEITIDEIGSINDYIQEEAGNKANIIMGVGEDENIGSSIAVTIIATGFGSDQQNQIVNTEAKKIIHTLEDDQPIEQFLMGETMEIKGFDSPIDLDHDKSIKTKVDLEEDNSETFDEEKKNDLDSDGISMKPIPQEIFDIPVISEHINIDELDIEKESESLSSDEINNLEVVYEILEFNSTEDQPLEFEEVSEATDHDFIINNLSNDILDMEIVDEVVICADEDSENQFTFDFALTTKNLNEIDEEKVANKLDDIENPVEDKGMNETMDFKFEIVEKPEKSELLDLSIENENLKPESPFDKSIQESVTSENENRKELLKKFNHSFKHSLSKIDEFEKQPAYKRMGLDLEQHSSSDSDESRISLDKDKNDDIQLRSNNSFLHDNVD
ncbi:MAG: cell division protein FtsZ [Flavobacteriaceae bacterium]|nr:cell division protein FtsZ [Flavobacteriaceae bacterium]